MAEMAKASVSHGESMQRSLGEIAKVSGSGLRYLSEESMQRSLAEMVTGQGVVGGRVLLLGHRGALDLL